MAVPFVEASLSEGKKYAEEVIVVFERGRLEHHLVPVYLDAQLLDMPESALLQCRLQAFPLPVLHVDLQVVDHRLWKVFSMRASYSLESTLLGLSDFDK